MQSPDHRRQGRGGKGAEIENQNEADGLQRRQTHQNKQRTRNRDRSAETEANHDQDDASVTGRCRSNQRNAPNRPGANNDILEQQSVDDHLHERPKRKYGSSGEGVEGNACRHAPKAQQSQYAATGKIPTRKDKPRLPPTGVEIC
jgi:hypothetical protein